MRSQDGHRGEVGRGGGVREWVLGLCVQIPIWRLPFAFKNHDMLTVFALVAYVFIYVYMHREHMVANCRSFTCSFQFSLFSHTRDRPKD